MNKTRIRLLIFAMTILVLSSIDIYIPMAPTLADYFTVDSYWIKITFLLGPLAVCIVGIPFGSLSDRNGRKPLLKTGLIFYLTGTLISACSTEFNTFFIGRVLQSIGVGGLNILGGAILADLYSGVSLARHLGLYSALFPLSFTLAPIVGAQLDSFFGWRAPFFFLFVSMTLVGLSLLFLVPETAELKEEKSLPVFSLLRGLLSSQTAMLLAVTHSLPITIGVLFTINGPFIYQEAFGINSVLFSYLQASPVAAQFSGTLVYRYLVPKIGLIACLKMGAMSTLLFVVYCTLGVYGTRAVQPVITVIAICLFSFGVTFVTISTNTLLMETAKGSKGLAVSMLALVRNITLVSVVGTASCVVNVTLHSLLQVMFVIALGVLLLCKLSLWSISGSASLQKSTL